MIKPGLKIEKILLTKKKSSSTWSGYAVKCDMHFDDKQVVSYYIEHAIELFNDEYTSGVYEWDGEKYNKIEEW